MWLGLGWFEFVSFGFFLRVGLAWIVVVFFKGWCGLDWVGLNLFLLGFFLRVGLAWIGLLLLLFF